ncbi:monofunctional biosynthetic peptidoglycan transglycosylase [Olivibacter sitiensis]|uniref:monofunctional biosynthetic peptidoglycan transglycosylase n=1 Tax=Olivibacter sitiensis TaxID=376470 RepID=UPI000422ED16|nr:monofunctional biosynthetic peptidoglycan transglycosylase [Olivibacter sitiensis]
MAIRRTKKKNSFKGKKSPSTNSTKKGKKDRLQRYNLLEALRQKDYKRSIALFFLYYFVATFTWVLALRFINPPITYLMIHRAFERKAEGKTFKIEKSWLNYGELSDNLKRAAIAGEDARFLVHHGFDTKAIQDAYKRNQQGKSVRGGSTISQQTAKNVFLWPGRSWFRKGFEVYFTVLIELLWSKQRILEVYLNVIEMGDGLYGAEAAAKNYFNKSGKSLTQRQAALIIAVLPNPRRWSPEKPTAFINRKASTIVRYMKYTKIP